jgi:hypothetical protein
MSDTTLCYDDYIARAMRTLGGHLWIGRGGFCLSYETSQLSGYDCETVKTLCITAGLPVIDSRGIDFGIAATLAVRGPMVAVNTTPSPKRLRCKLSL